jgi:hypothetical protein
MLYGCGARQRQSSVEVFFYYNKLGGGWWRCKCASMMQPRRRGDQRHVSWAFVPFNPFLIFTSTAMAHGHAYAYVRPEQHDRNMRRRLLVRCSGTDGLGICLCLSWSPVSIFLSPSCCFTRRPTKLIVTSVGMPDWLMHLHFAGVGH